MSLSEENESKYSIINEQNIPNDLGIVDKQNKIDNLSQNLVEDNQQKGIAVNYLLYGNPIETINPKFIGKSFAFKYDSDGNPKITIGPDCKYFLLFYRQL